MHGIKNYDLKTLLLRTQWTGPSPAVVEIEQIHHQAAASRLHQDTKNTKETPEIAVKSLAEPQRGPANGGRGSLDVMALRCRFSSCSSSPSWLQLLFP